MTTVAYDGYTLAADAQGTKDNSAGGKCPHCAGEVHETHHMRCKVVHPRNNLELTFNDQKIIAWAGAGDANLIEALGTALKAKIPIEEAARILSAFQRGLKRTASCTILLVTDQSVWSIKCSAFFAITVKEITEFPYAIGSGSPAARLAMRRYGLSAMAAVALAIDNDQYTGGTVSYIQCRNTTEHKVESYNYTEEDILELTNTNKE